MKKEQFIEYIKAPQQLNEASSFVIEKLITEFPYCQLAQILYAKNLHNLGSVHYKNQLKLASAYSSDREKLYKLIMQKPLSEKIAAIEDELSADIPNKDNALAEKEITETGDEKHITEVEQEILNKAISASITLEADDYADSDIKKDKVKSEQSIHKREETTTLRSFNDWLQYSPAKSEDTTSATSDSSLIDQFLVRDEKQKTEKSEFFSPVNMARLSVIEDENFVTETLAKIYIDQGRYSKAVNAFKQLIVKNPSKSSYFAAQIERIKNLKDT